MPVFRPLGSPPRSPGIAQCILYGIQRLLDQFVQCFTLDVIPVAEQAGHACIADKHAVGPDVLAELQEFVVSESVGAAVSPQVVLSGAFHRFADGLFPAHPVLEREPFHDASARPADKCGAELLDERGHILAQSVAPALVGLPGKQGDVIEPDVPFVRKDQMEFVPSSVGRCRECRRVAPPCPVGRDGDCAGSNLASVLSDDLGPAARRAFGPEVELEVVLFPGFGCDSPVSAVHDVHLAACGLQLHVEGMRRRVVERITVRYGGCRLRTVGVLHPPSGHLQVGAPPDAEAVDRVVRVAAQVRGRGVAFVVERAARREHSFLETPVAYHLGIQSAVSRSGDLLEEYSVERGGNLRPAFAEVDFDPAFRVDPSRDDGCGQQADAGEHFFHGSVIHLSCLLERISTDLVVWTV